MYFLACINGDIMKIDFTGASEATVSRLPKNLKYKSKIIKVGRAKQMDPAVIAAIISRESRAGAALKDGLGDHGNGFGLIAFTRMTNHLIREVEIWLAFALLRFPTKFHFISLHFLLLPAPAKLELSLQ
uniref:Uncharacterized protein n=1 Tax=Sinocyclocheilus grahami TaxID=75366 RepID=A0A672MTU1_SINGR